MSSQKNLFQLRTEVSVDCYFTKLQKARFCVLLLSNMQVLGNLIYELSVFKIMHKKMVRLAYKINAFAMSEQKRCMKGNTT